MTTKIRIIPEIHGDSTCVNVEVRGDFGASNENHIIKKGGEAEFYVYSGQYLIVTEVDAEEENYFDALGALAEQHPVGRP